MLRVTLVPTRASASEKENVIPSRAEVLVDCRVPPGDGRGRGPRARRGACWARRPRDSSSSSPSRGRATARPPTRRWPTAIEEWLAEADPGGHPGPDRDGRASATATGSARRSTRPIVYGFCPQREMSLLEATPLIHGADERAAVADIELAARFYRDIVQAVLG